MLTLIDRNLVPLCDRILSSDTVDRIWEILHEPDVKVLIYLNRRGAYRAFICEDCSHTWKCPNCDVALTLHTSPENILLCHHCNTRVSLPIHCPKCRWTNLKGVGLAIQSVEAFLRKQFPEIGICRLDRDQKGLDRSARIFLGTEYVLRHDIGRIWLAVTVLPEAELNIPEFDVEERVYANIRALASIADECRIETHAPQLPLIEDIMKGNYKSFLTRILSERKRYRYPPYSGLAYIEVHHTNVGALEDMCAKLHNKLNLRAKELSVTRQTEYSSESPDAHASPVIRYDRSVRMKRWGEYIDMIMVRSDRLQELLDPIRMELLRNRNVELHVRGEKILP